jgi:hypothetical protein
LLVREKVGACTALRGWHHAIALYPSDTLCLECKLCNGRLLALWCPAIKFHDGTLPAARKDHSRLRSSEFAWRLTGGVNSGRRISSSATPVTSFSLRSVRRWKPLHVSKVSTEEPHWDPLNSTLTSEALPVSFAYTAAEEGIPSAGVVHVAN